jgi:hypothetical protein
MPAASGIRDPRTEAAMTFIDADAIRIEAEAMLAENGEAEKEGETAENEMRTWPVLSQKAFHGLPGEIVRMIEPHTEADNAALLIQLLVGFGSLIGKTAYFRIGGDYHFTKLFAVLVGATATGRKGTSWSEIERLLVRVDESFRDAVQNGLSSGEGLIYHVRDQVTASKPVREKGGAIACYQDEIIDEGSKEKRAFVIEPEFARVLKVITREGNTLSSVIRQSWDTDRLSVMTKNPLRATEAHITIAGHITETELIRNLQETETANGFANRFLWICVRRSKYLPDGGNLQESDLNDAVIKLQIAVRCARITKELKRDTQANKQWHQVYRRLSDGFGGLLGSVTSRATAQVMRLACVYSLLDCAEVIRLEHLEAALAVWRYCEDSAKYIFGMNTGDKLANAIEKALKEHPEELTKTALFDLCGRNKSAAEIDAALNLLIELGRIEKRVKNTDGKRGRPAEVFTLKNYELNESIPADGQSE